MLQVFLLEGRLWPLLREDTGAWFKEQLYPPGKDRDWGLLDTASQVWGRPPGWATEGLGNRPVLQYLKDGFKLSSCYPSLQQIVLRDHLFMSPKTALFATTDSCCEQPIMTCLYCSHVDDS